MSLIEPADMPAIEGVDVPQQVYLVTRQPAPLAGMVFPRWRGLRWEALAQLGVGSILCLTGDTCPYQPDPLRILGALALEDLYHGGPPRDPAAEERLLRRAADRVLRELLQGQGVIVHCEGGTGRTGTVIGCVLRGLGREAPDVVEYLDRLNKRRGKLGWPESPWQAEMVRQYRT
jgi:hypothetical protein